jgi:hypothetical protein
MFALHDFTFACTFIAYDSIAENPLHFYDIAANQNVSTRTRLLCRAVVAMWRVVAAKRPHTISLCLGVSRST